MTDKQIMIDGVDVSGCEYCLKMTKYRCTIQRDVYKCLCEENPNCYYKQLKRKENELEELRQYHNKCCKEFENEKQELFEKYNQVSTNFYNGDYCNTEHCSSLKAKEQECEELKREKRNFYNFLTNKYNYGSFRPMWGTYLLRRFFKEDLGDFFDEEAYKMTDTIEEKEKQLDRYSQTLTEIKEIAKKQCVCGVGCIDMKQILQKISEVLNDR